MEIVDDMQISLFASSASSLEEFKKEIDFIANSQGVVIQVLLLATDLFLDTA